MILSPPRAQGFTLLEILIATSLTLVIVLIATTTLFQLLSTTRRANATMSMHTAAQNVHDRLARETAAMHPCAAVWLLSDPTTQSIELIFLRGKEHPYDFPVNGEVGLSAVKLGFTDQVWTRWHWSESTGILSVAESRSARQFQLDNGDGSSARNFWQTGNNMDVSGAMTSSTFVSIPQPRRETQAADDPTTAAVNESLPAKSPKHVLNQNRWQSGLSTTAQAYLTADLGDYDDLLRNAWPVLQGCSQVTIEVVDAAGVAHTADGQSMLAWAAAGSFVDGGLSSRGVNRGFTASDRPGLVRIHFTLSDPRTDATFDYSFSFSTPHAAPY